MYPQTRSIRTRASSSSAEYESGKNSSVGKMTVTARKASHPNSSSSHSIDSSSHSLSSSSTGHVGVDQNIEGARYGQFVYELRLARMAISAGTSNHSNPFTRKKRNPQKPSRLIHFPTFMQGPYYADIGRNSKKPTAPGTSKAKSLVPFNSRLLYWLACALRQTNGPSSLNCNLRFSKLR